MRKLVFLRCSYNLHDPFSILEGDVKCFVAVILHFYSLFIQTAFFSCFIIADTHLNSSIGKMKCLLYAQNINIDVA